MRGTDAMMRHSWTPHWPGTPTFRSVVRPRLSFDRATLGQLTWPIVLLVSCCLLIGAATGLVTAPSRAPSPPPAANSPAVSRVLPYAVGWLGPDEDPTVTLPSGLRVKASNYRGVPIDGVSYYYNLAPRPSFDPLARGELSADQIQIVAVVGDPPNRVTIYRSRCPMSGVRC